MRIRLQLLSPFKEAKLLLPVPDTLASITELRKHVRQSLSAIRDIAPSTKDLLLEIDGFELLPGSLVKEVVEERDVITVRLRAGSSRKRSASASQISSAVGDGNLGQAKRRKVDPALLALSVEAMKPVKVDSTPVRATTSGQNKTSASLSPPSSSSASSSSSGSSSSSSSSASSSSSSSSSDTDSDDSVSANPSLPILPPHLRPKTALQNQAFTPPGQGKEGTQNRNQRRRQARLKKKAQEDANKDKSSHVIDEAPEREGLSTSTNVVSFTQSELPVPRSMANRNKKKGFMKEMINAQGTKIVFGEDAEARSTPVAQQARLAEGQEESISVSVILTPQHTGQSTSKRVLPPSEMDLPSNVFVTHQVYDRRGWTPKGRGGRRQTEVVVEEEEAEEDEQDMEVDVEEEQATDIEAKVPSALPNGNSDVFTATAPTAEDDGDDWTKAENGFDDLPILDMHPVPVKDTVIAWKELQLDTYSFTPQLKVQLGKVAEVSAERVVIKRMERYDADEDDPYNGQPEEMVVEKKAWEETRANYRFIADSKCG